jgi:cyclopropane fatty-acyl-phospholipid synthase-like methyltransferase
MATENSAAPAPTNAELKTLVENGYDAIASTYLAWSAPRPTTTRLQYVTQLLDLLSPGASVLELGCGAGVPSTQALVKHGLDVTGVDISAAQIALAGERVPEAKLIQGDMMSLSFELGSFDAIVAFYSVFHLPKDEQGPMIERMSGWLKKGGWLLFNLRADEGDQLMDDWMGTRMFSSGLGVEGNRETFKKYGKNLKIVEDKVDVEKVGRNEAEFHWFFAVRDV